MHGSSVFMDLNNQPLQLVLQASSSFYVVPSLPLLGTVDLHRCHSHGRIKNRRRHSKQTGEGLIPSMLPSWQYELMRKVSRKVERILGGIVIVPTSLTSALASDACQECSVQNAEAAYRITGIAASLMLVISVQSEHIYSSKLNLKVAVFTEPPR
jgi:hypothetical protein